MKKMIAACLMLLLTACQGLSGWSKGNTPPAENILDTAWEDRTVFSPGLSESARAILEELPGASVYHLDLELANDLAGVQGREEVRYTNTEGTALDEVRLRLFPNILGGEMMISHVSVDGEPVTPRLSMQDSLLAVHLPAPLQPGDSLILSINFAVNVPRKLELNYGVLAYADDVLALAHAYPMIAVYDDEGWNAEIPPQSGDVTYADMAFFLVRVSAPRGVVLVAAGREVDRTEDGGRQIVSYAAGPVRDFYLAASRSYEIRTEEAGDVTLRFYAPADLQAGARQALETASRSIEVYEARYADYPYSELDFVATPTLALGIEYPGMIAITEEILSPGHPYLEGTVAHEVGHQWFYNLVGNDQLDDPWLDESLAQFATLQFYLDEYGARGGQGFRSSLTGRLSRVDDGEMPVGLPVAAYTGAEYSAIVYGKGPLFFEALRDELGQEAFDAFIRSYVQANAWSIATPEGLQSGAEAECACDLSALFDEWVYPP